VIVLVFNEYVEAAADGLRIAERRWFA